MPIASYIFIEAQAGKPLDIAKRIRKLPGVKFANAITGLYDVIAYVEVERMEEMGPFITERIHRIPGVIKTTTNMVLG